MAYATAVTANVTSTGITSTHQWSGPYGRICWAHPIGDSQDRLAAQLPDDAASPTARSR